MTYHLLLTSLQNLLHWQEHFVKHVFYVTQWQMKSLQRQIICICIWRMEMVLSQCLLQHVIWAWHKISDIFLMCGVFNYHCLDFTNTTACSLFCLRLQGICIIWIIWYKEGGMQRADVILDMFCIITNTYRMFKSNKQ